MESKNRTQQAGRCRPDKYSTSWLAQLVDPSTLRGFDLNDILRAALCSKTLYAQLTWLFSTHSAFFVLTACSWKHYDRSVPGHHAELQRGKAEDHSQRTPSSRSCTSTPTYLRDQQTFWAQLYRYILRARFVTKQNSALCQSPVLR